MSSVPNRLPSPPAPTPAAGPVVSGPSLADRPDNGLRELMALREIVHAFLTAERPEDVFQFALDKVSPLVGACTACVYLIEEGSELMRLAAVHNWPHRYARFLGDMRVRIGFGPSGQAARDRQMIEVPDVFADESMEDWQEVASELGFRSFVALPLQTPGAVLGTVTFYFAVANSISDETRHLMRTVADQMAATAEKARLIQDLQRANTALKSSNTQLERQYMDVLEARRMKDEFLANIWHELRTPLTAVIGYIALMQEGIGGPVSDEQKRTLEQVKGASEHLLALIADLLELTALKRGLVELDITEFDPREPLHEALAAAKGRRENVELEVIEPDDPPYMKSDHHTIVRAVTTLLDNAYKFTHDGKIRVLLTIHGEHAAYTIEDTGIGIPAEAHRMIFDEFRQVDGSTTRGYGGSGLGLSLARRLARLVHGDISLTSTPGVGSTFRFDLPLRIRS